MKNCQCEQHRATVQYKHLPGILWVGLPNGHEYDINNQLELDETRRGGEVKTVKYTISAITFLNEREQHYYSKIYVKERSKAYDGMQDGGRLQGVGAKTHDFSEQGIYDDKNERWHRSKAVVVVYRRTTT